MSDSESEDNSLVHTVMTRLKKLSQSLQTEYEHTERQAAISDDLQKRIKDGHNKLDAASGYNRSRVATLELSNWGYQNERKLTKLEHEIKKLKRSATCRRSLAESVVTNRCEFITYSENGLKFYQLKAETVFVDYSYKTRRVVVDSADEWKQKETNMVLLVGVTGCGKTLLLNNIVNYFFGVNLEDEWRLKLVDQLDEIEERELGEGEEGEERKRAQDGVNVTATPKSGTNNRGNVESGKSDDYGNGTRRTTRSGSCRSSAKSMTSWVTGYELRWHQGARCPWNLYLVDSPGFGDDRGLEQDAFIVSQMQAFLDNNETCIVNEVASVAFVMRASTTRLTKEYNYVINEVLNLFAKNLEPNMSVIYTFADAADPPALHVVAESDIKHNHSFKLNNSALFADNNEESTRYMWKFGFATLRSFFDHLNTTATVSWDDTRFVLNERERLQTILDDVRNRVNASIQLLSAMESNIDQIKRLRQTQVDCDSYLVMETSATLSMVEVDFNVLNCNRCKHSCKWPYRNYLPCYFQGVFDRKGRCTVCDQKCPRQQHVIEPKLYQMISESELVPLEDIYSKYRETHEEQMDKETLLERMKEAYVDMEEQLSYVIIRGTRVYRNLDHLAMRNSNISNVDYIRHLIAIEMKNTSEAGKEERLKFLRSQEELATCALELSRGQRGELPDRIKSLEAAVYLKLESSDLLFHDEDIDTFDCITLHSNKNTLQQSFFNS